MSYPFSPQKGLIRVAVEVQGPLGKAVLTLGLDTGATISLVGASLLVALGYDPALAPNRVQVTTGSGVEYVPLLPLTKVNALGHNRFDFPVLCHTLPPSASVDGLLGLDFLRAHVLTLDCLNGQITLV